MLKLRRAELTDFETYKKLYEDPKHSYQWMFYDYLSKDDIKLSEEDKKSIEWKLGSCAEVAENYKNYSLEKYQEDLKNINIYIIEENSETLGYLTIWFMGNGRYKIAEWAMFNPTDDDTKRKVLDKLLEIKLPLLQEFWACAIHDSVEKFFLENGFEIADSCSAFLKLEVGNDKKRNE